MARRRYSDKELAVIWAMRCRQGETAKPIEIRRALERDELGLGYSLAVPKRTMQDILKRLERQYGKPVQQVQPGQEAEAATAVRAMAIGTTRAQIQKLRAKDAAGETLGVNEMKALAVAEKMMADITRRERIAGTVTRERARTNVENGSAATSSLTNRLVQELATHESDGKEGEDTVLHAHTRTAAPSAGPA